MCVRAEGLLVVSSSRDDARANDDGDCCRMSAEPLWTVLAYVLEFGLGALVLVAAYTWRTAARETRPVAQPAPGAGSSSGRRRPEPT
jgi:hypothetical protein